MNLTWVMIKPFRYQMGDNGEESNYSAVPEDKLLKVFSRVC